MNVFYRCFIIFSFIFNLSYGEVVLLNEKTKLEKTNEGVYQKNKKNNNNKKNTKLKENKKDNERITNIKKVDKDVPKTVIKYDSDSMNSINNNEREKINAITYFTFGTHNKPLIEIYVSPSCLHCAYFLVEDLEAFLKKNNNECFVKVILLPSLDYKDGKYIFVDKDFFIMKLIQAEAKDVNGYYMIFCNYMKRVLATINKTNPSKEQRELYKGSETDDEMIKYQVIAHDFKFSDDKITNAIPNMDNNDYEHAKYELAIKEHYKRTVKEIFTKLNLDTQKSPELEVPLIICNGKKYKTLEDALKECQK